MHRGVAARGHGPEFEADEAPAQVADALLAEQDRPGGNQPDQARNAQHQLMLLRRHARRPRRLLAETQKAAQIVAKQRQLPDGFNFVFQGLRRLGFKD